MLATWENGKTDSGLTQDTSPSTHPRNQHPSATILLLKARQKAAIWSWVGNCKTAGKINISSSKVFVLGIFHNSKQHDTDRTDHPLEKFKILCEGQETKPCVLDYSIHPKYYKQIHRIFIDSFQGLEKSKWITLHWGNISSVMMKLC